MSEKTDPESDDHVHVEEGPGRLEAFSDAVMAVIMTIMALELHPPEGVSWEALQARIPGLLVYALSFAFIGIYWNNHHHLLRATRRISAAVMWSNLFLLFCLSLIPVATDWIREDFAVGPPTAGPAAAYGLVSLACGLAYSLLVRSIIRANGKDSAVAQAIARDAKGWISLVAYAAGVALAFVSPYISFVLYVAVSVMWFIPDRRFVHDH